MHGGVLARQLGLEGLLLPGMIAHGDENVIQRMRLLTWHFWWHVGIRRYHGIKQQQQDCLAAAANRGNSTSRRKGYKSAAGYNTAQTSQQQLEQLEQLYLDADARYYAIGFASRQLAPCGTTLSLHQSCQNPHNLHYANLMAQIRTRRAALLNPRVSASAGAAEAEGQLALAADAETSTGSAFLRAPAQKICQLVAAVERETDERQKCHNLLFPPTFRAADAVGASADCVTLRSSRSSRLQGSARAGEASLLVFDPPVGLEHPEVWADQYDDVMDMCDVCLRPIDQVCDHDALIQDTLGMMLPVWSKFQANQQYNSQCRSQYYTLVCSLPPGAHCAHPSL